jgi:hypothetical protein
VSSKTAEGGPRATRVYDRHTYDREKRLALDTWTRTLKSIIEHGLSRELAQPRKHHAARCERGALGVERGQAARDVAVRSSSSRRFQPALEARPRQLFCEEYDATAPAAYASCVDTLSPTASRRFR